MKKVFVTGGSGFIGTPLVKYLVEAGYDVTNYDIKKPITNFGNYIEGNILDYLHLKTSMEGHDAVCHLAAVVGVKLCFEDDDYVNTVNHLGTVNILKAIEENGINNLLYASSSEVYGQGSKEKLLTEETQLSPVTVYGKSKLMGEDAVKEISQRTNIKGTVIRYCNIYGENQREEFVIPIFIKNALENNYLDIVGDGSQIRSFTHVKDAVRGTVQALLDPKQGFEVYNISSQEPITIGDLANTIIKIADKGTVRYVRGEQIGRVSDKEILYRIPSSKKAQQLLNFTIQKDLFTSLTDLVLAYKNNKR